MGDAASKRPADGGSRGDHRRAAGSSVLTPPTGVPTVPDLGTAIPSQREELSAAQWALPAPTTPPAPPAQRTAVEPCTCGHALAAHDHYRPGTDCGACGATGCGAYRPVGGPIRRLLRRLRLVG
ncbi:MAG: hypothetical protein V7646_3172 [Pseudonocardia sp.]